MRKKVLFPVIILILFVAIFSVGFKYLDNEKEVSEIKKISTKCVELNHTLTVISSELEECNIFSKYTKEEHKNKVKYELENILSDKYGLLSMRKGQLEGSLYAQEESNFRVLNAGIKNTKFINLEIDENEAHVELELTSFCKMKFSENNGVEITEPETKESHKIDLIKAEGVWKVAKHSFDILEGFNP